MIKIMWSILQSSQMAPLLSPDTFAPEAQPILEEIARTAEPAIPRKMDFSETYKNGRKPRTQQPILPSDCRLVSLDQGKQHRLELEDRDAYTVRIAMKPEFSQAPINILQ